jgi:hypothetical protein
LGFLDRLVFSRTSPRPDWITLVSDEILFERDIGDLRVWRFSDGDAVGIYFFNLVPDLPKSKDLASFVAKTRDRVVLSGAALVECSVVTLGDTRGIRQVIKLPQNPTGMTFLGSFTLPFEKFSYVIKVQCEEHGVTGIREAVLLDEALQNGTVEINVESSNPIKGEWDPDSEKFDGRFPTHPLSRLRRHLAQIESCVSIDKALRRHLGFRLPEDRT